MASKVPGSALQTPRINLRSAGAAQGLAVIPVVDVRCSYRLPQSIINTANPNVMKLAVPTTHMAPSYQYFKEMHYYSNSAAELLENGFNLTDPIAGTWVKQGAIWHEHEVPTDAAIQAVGYQRIDYSTFSPNDLTAPRGTLEAIKTKEDMRLRLAPIKQVWIKGNPEAIAQPFVWVSGYNRHQVQAWIHSQNTQDPFMMRSLAELFISGQSINSETLRQHGFNIMFEGTADEIAILQQSDKTYLQWKPGCTLEQMRSMQIKQHDFLRGQYSISPERTLSYLTVIQDKDRPEEDTTQILTALELRQAGFSPDSEITGLWVRPTNIYNSDGQQLVHIWMPNKTLNEIRTWYLANQSRLKPYHVIAPYIPGSALDRAIYSTEPFHRFTIVPEQPIPTSSTIDVSSKDTREETLLRLKTYTSKEDSAPSTSYRSLTDETYKVSAPKSVVTEKVSKATTTDPTVISRPSASAKISSDSYTTLSKYSSKTPKPAMLDKQIQTDELLEITLRSTAAQTDPEIKAKPEPTVFKAKKLEPPLPPEFLPSARRPSYDPGHKKIEGYYTDSAPKEFMPQARLPDYQPGYKIVDSYPLVPDEEFPIARVPDYLPGYKIPDGFYSDSATEALPTARRPSYPPGYKITDGYYSDSETEAMPKARRPSYPPGYKMLADYAPKPEKQAKERMPKAIPLPSSYAMPKDYPNFDSLPESMPRARPLAPRRGKDGMPLTQSIPSTRARPLAPRRKPEATPQPMPSDVESAAPSTRARPLAPRRKPEATPQPKSEARVHFARPRESSIERDETGNRDTKLKFEDTKKASSRSGRK